MSGSSLVERRQTALQAWSAFVASGGTRTPGVRPEIRGSWSRSVGVPTDLLAAPLADEQETRDLWRSSALRVAVSRVERDLRRTAEDGDLVLAVADPSARILWTHGGRVMRSRAEGIHFVPGGRWDEQSVGTNALALATHRTTPAMVFGAEHYAPIVHGWVCWAAPIREPGTGRILGVVDLSTTWDRTHPIGLATAGLLARLVEDALPRTRATGLGLRLLGTAEARLDGGLLPLPRRQSEILALLALHPEGLSLGRLHTLLYGDQPVTSSTLKAEVSHLRAAVQGQLASRPYRLSLPVHTDVDDVLAALRAGDVRAAVSAYGGDLMPGTDAPGLVETGTYLAVSLREALLRRPDPEAVLGYSDLVPHDTAVLEACLDAPGTGDHPAAPLLRARLITGH
ncbi:sigma-54-dependent transcriptional regulator family protein [Nocardioides campestrisoli]|uniref:transcriptional regulator n=1 Tax=Nocardioides campestrisoli TaxID=2736757 RepID=UPI00163DA894|nr:transcriptional regulator [Nocardioides campestrisoli]